MQKKESRFQLNIQVVIVLALTMAALTLPLFGAVLFLRSLLQGTPKPAVETVDESALRQALLQASEKTLPAPQLEKETIVRTTPDVAAERRTIEESAKAVGGVAVLMEPAEDNRLLVQIPAEKVTEFLSKISGSAQNEPPKGTLQGNSAIFDITLKKSPP